MIGGGDRDEHRGPKRQLNEEERRAETEGDEREDR
jgi:hypothetical protein